MVQNMVDNMTPIDKEKAIECLGDETVFETMVTTFLDEVDQMMLVLEDAVENGDSELIKEKAHWIKGGLVYLHAGPSANAAKELEMAAGLEPSKVQAAHQKLCAEVERLKTALSV